MSTHARRSSPRPVVASLLSAVVPGVGQWYAGYRRRALWWGIPFVFAVAAVGFTLTRGTVSVVAKLVQPQWLLSLMLVNLVAALLRIGAAFDGYRIAGGSPRARVVIPTMVVVAALMAPHVMVGSHAADLSGLLDSVFVDDEGVRVAAADAARYRGAESRSAPTVPAEERGTLLVLADGVLTNQPDGIQRRVTPAFGEIPLPSIVTIEDGSGRLTILLAGGDAGPGRSGLRTDVMIVATIDLDTGQAALVSVSRELVGFPMPVRWADRFEEREEFFWQLHRDRDLAGTSLATDPAPEEFEPQGIWPDRINAVYPFARGVVDPFYRGSPDPAMDALADTLELALGLPIPFWVLVDMEGFVDLVDAIGGVQVYALEPMHVTFSPEREGAEEIRIDIEPGRHRLDGRTALAYVRNRSDSSDYVRTRRQRCMLREVAAGLNTVTLLANFGRITSAVERHTTTNIPLRLLPGIVEAVGGIDRSSVLTMAIQASEQHAPDSNYRGLRIIDVDAVQSSIARVLRSTAEEYRGETIRDECG